MKHNGDRCQPLERPHFVTGQILTADDLLADHPTSAKSAAVTIGSCVMVGTDDETRGFILLRLELWAGPGFAISSVGRRDLCPHSRRTRTRSSTPRVESRWLRYGRRRPWSVRPRSLILTIPTCPGTGERARVSSLLFSTTCPAPTSTGPTEYQQLGWPGGGCAGMCPD